MKKYLVLLLTLSACSHWADYQPKLAAQPKDMAKYEADRHYCLDDAMRRRNTSSITNADAYKLPRDMVDECMANRGYAVVKR